MADSTLNELSLITTPTMNSPLYTVESNSDKRMLIKDISQVIGDENIAPAYDATETYSEGDYCMQEGKLYQANQDIDTPETFDATKWDAVKVTEISGGASVVQLTQAEYTALSTAEKMNGSIYKLTDKAIFYCLDEEYHAVKELTSAQYEALTTAQQNNGTIYIQTDKEMTGSDIAVSDTVSTSIADAINAFNAKRITPTVSNVHSGMTVDASYRDVFDLGGFYYIAIKINITTAIGTWRSLFDIAEITTTQAVRFFAQHQTTTDKAICYCLNNSIQSQTALNTGDWWLIAVIPKI